MIDYKVIIAADVARVCAKYSQVAEITEDEAMQIFLGSATYRTLIDVKTGLCFEMFEAIYDMFLEEVAAE